MIWKIVDRAAQLAERGEATVDAAMSEYGKIAHPQGCDNAQAWVSVAFLCNRQKKMLDKLNR